MSSNIHVLVAGPGTGKTTKIVERIKQLSSTDGLLVISFTNATVKQLRKDILRKAGKDLADDKCTTLHKLALRLAATERQYVLTEKELSLIQRDAKCLNKNYERICELLNCKDFNQVIRKAIDYIKTNPTLVKERLGSVDLLLIDEYQDFNVEEQELLRSLALLTQETWIIGDDDQAIYDFKQANPQGIIDIYSDVNHFKIEHEGVCYRCPALVVKHATNLIKNNANRVNKPWIANGKVGSFCVAQFLTKEDEENAIIKKITEILENDSESSILILYANDIALHDFDKKLLEKSVEFQQFTKNVAGIYELRHLLHIYLNHDVFLHLRLLINSKLDTQHTKEFYSLVETADTVPTTIDDLLAFFKGHKKLTDLAYTALLTLIEAKQNISSILESPGFKKAKEVIGETDDSEKMLMALDKYVEEQQALNESGINLMTIHKSKGLEADYVFVMGVTNGVLPMLKPGTTMEGQRRLMFVAITRCKKGIYVSTAATWTLEEKLVHKVQKDKFKFNWKKKIWYAEASPFITEMSIDVQTSFI